MADDRELWDRLCRGDGRAFESLYQQYGSRIRSFVRHYVDSAQAAEDVSQETFLQIWKWPNGFDPERGPLKRYLFGIARKRAAQWLRERRIVAVDGAPEARAGGSEATAALREALARLDPDSRGLLWLREVEGYSYAELAEILDIPVGTVKSRLFAAREQARRVWQAEHDARQGEP